MSLAVGGLAARAIRTPYDINWHPQRGALSIYSAKYFKCGAPPSVGEDFAPRELPTGLAVLDYLVLVRATVAGTGTSPRLASSFWRVVAGTWRPSVVNEFQTDDRKYSLP